jgi:hypothetical protein
VNVGTTLAPTWLALEDIRIIPDQIYAKIITDALANDFHREPYRRPMEIRSRIETEGLQHIPTTANHQLVSYHPPLPSIHSNNSVEPLYADKDEPRHVADTFRSLVLSNDPLWWSYTL